MTTPLKHALKLPPDRDAAARQDFVSQLRGYILNDLADTLRRSYEQETLPAFQREHGRAPATQDEVHEAILGNTCFRFYSAIRVNAQEMVWRSVIPGVERSLGDIEGRIDELGRSAKGSLTLDPALAMPKNMKDLDVHLMPGGYAPSQDAAAGAVYDNGLAVFAAGMMGHEFDDIGLSMANWVKHRHPDFKPRSVLDCGATVGHNTAAWARTFPRAEVHAIDVSAAVLRYGHGRAESMGLPIHFRQMNATKLAYEDASFDVVFTSMFLHELPLADIRRFFAEAHRVLRPGGLILNMELPPNAQLTPYDQFYLDWDCYYNREPYYRGYRDQSPRELVTGAGFAGSDYFEIVIPQYSYVGEEQFAKAIGAGLGVNQDTGRLSSGVQWFGFGAWKRP